MQHRPYPSLQLECVTTLIDITRRGALRAEIKEAAKCAYELGGAVLGVTVGEPADLIVGDASSGDNGAPFSETYVEPSLQELETCHAQLTASAPELEAFGAEDAEAQIDPATMALIIQLALKALEFFMNRKALEFFMNRKRN